MSPIKFFWTTFFSGILCNLLKLYTCCPSSTNGQVSSQVPLGAPYMLSPPPRRQQCHHPAGSPKAGKHLQQQGNWQLACSRQTVQSGTVETSLWTISDPIVTNQAGSIGKTGSRGCNPLMLTRSAGDCAHNNQ